MAHRSTSDLSTPKNLWASSLGRTSEGLDWLGIFFIQEIKFSFSSVPAANMFDDQIHMVIAGLTLDQARLDGLIICEDYQSLAS